MSPGPDRSDGWHLQGMIILSMFLHCVVLALVFFTPSFPSPKITFGPVYTVSLVSAPASTLVQRPDAALDRALVTEKRPETVLKKALDPQAIPIRPLETKKKQESPLEKAMEEIRRKAAAQEASRPSGTRAATDKAAAPAAAQTAPGSGDAELNAQLRAYYSLIWARIKGKWALPQGMLPREVLETVIDVTILKSGAVTELKYEKRSGNRYFDESALKAIQKAGPFPPLPAGIGESSLDLGIRFHSSELTR